MARFHLRPILFLVLGLFALAGSAAAEDSRIAEVRSATQFVISTDAGPITLNLFGVGGPAPSQPGGQSALEFARSVALGRPVDFQTVTSPRDGRVKARIRLHGTRDLAEILVEAGYAWWDSEAAPREAYLQALQQKAQRAGAGLWSLGASKTESSPERVLSPAAVRPPRTSSAPQPETASVPNPPTAGKVRHPSQSQSPVSAELIGIVTISVLLAAALFGFIGYLLLRGKGPTSADSERGVDDPKVAASSRRVIEDLLRTLSDSVGELMQLSDRYSDRMDGHKAAIKKAMTVAGLEEIEKLLTKEIEGIEASNEKYRSQLKAANTKLQEQEELIGQIRSEAKTDFLTQIPNRRALELRLKEELTRTLRHGGAFCLVLFDIDHFKQVNDRYGHPAGDKVLQAVANIIKGHIRQSDSVYRFGGEEFALILPETGARAARIVADKVRSALSRVSIRYELAKISVTISAGVAEVDVASDSQETLISRADAALYQAKREGRNRIVVASADAPESKAA